MIEIKVDGRVVSVQETEPLFAGAVDVQRCHFAFDKSWTGFSKTAIFRAGEEMHTKLLDDDGCCVLPWELLTRKNTGYRLEGGVYGGSADTKIMASVWDSLGMIREGARPGNDARNPVDGVYEQIMAKLQRLYEAMGIQDEGLAAVVQRAETAAQLAAESAAQAARTLEEVRNELANGGAADIPYCIEYGALAYHSGETEELTFQFTQSYESEPVFILYANHGALELTAEPLRSETGFYGGKITVTNMSGESIAATVAVSAYCAQPAGEGSEGE